MNILIDNRCADSSIDEAGIMKLALFAMRRLDLPEGTEISITFVDNDEMRILNRRYRDIDKPTDVLSFECDHLDDEFPIFDEGSTDGDGRGYVLGDVVIAPAVAMEQSEIYGNSFDQEIDLLLIHGILHLCGYDHIADEDAEVMEDNQRRLLDEWKNGSSGEIS